jgi:hypothetical protein
MAATRPKRVMASNVQATPDTEAPSTIGMLPLAAFTTT